MVIAGMRGEGEKEQDITWGFWYIFIIQFKTKENYAKVFFPALSSWLIIRPLTFADLWPTTEFLQEVVDSSL